MPDRVIVWGTGNVGVPALRIVLSNPALELAGVVVANPAKVGRDAGELCGLPATGVRATNEVAAALALRAPEWPKPKGDGAHGVIITGRPNLTVTFDPEDDAGSAAGGCNITAAARIVNAIPFVCAAPAGMLDALQVPLPIGRGLVG